MHPLCLLRDGQIRYSLLTGLFGSLLLLCSALIAFLLLRSALLPAVFLCPALLPPRAVRKRNGRGLIVYIARRFLLKHADTERHGYRLSRPERQILPGDDAGFLIIDTASLRIEE